MSCQDHLNHTLHDLAQGALRVGQKAENAFGTSFYLLKRHLLDFNTFAFWDGQKTEYKFAGHVDPF
jgi:hypothetical protein